MTDGTPAGRDDGETGPADARGQAEGWEFIVDEATGAGIPGPPRWHRRDDTAAVIALVDRFVPSDGAFRPNVNVIVEKPHPILTDLDVFTVRAIQNMQGGMTDMHLIDLEPVEIGGHPGRHLTSAYRSGTYSLALEQWWTVVDGTATTLSATCAVEDYARLGQIFDVVAAGLVPATGRPATDEPATDEPATDEPATDEPTADGPAAGQVQVRPPAP